jgi:hypothetical protein
VVHLDTPLGEELLDVAVRQREAQVPAHREHDHLGREAEASEGRPFEGGPDAVSSHDTSLAALGWLAADATEPVMVALADQVPEVLPQLGGGIGVDVTAHGHDGRAVGGGGGGL